MEIEITNIESDTAACRHSQDDGSDQYYGLRVYAKIDGQDRMLFFRMSEHGYPGNDAMIPLLNQLALTFHVGKKELS